MFFFCLDSIFLKIHYFFVSSQTFGLGLNYAKKTAEQQKNKTTGRYTTSDREVLELCFPPKMPIMICNLKR